MDRVAVFVDAGYLYAGGAKSVSGVDGTRRHDITLDIPQAIAYLISTATAISRQELLRIYWYDAAPSSRLTTDHQILASTDNVKLRLGVINGFGEQKGVDGKIITDLAELSRNRAFADAVLLGGDEDLRIGVELAQEYGTRVHLITIEGSSSSPTLRQESDTTTVISRAHMGNFLAVRTQSTAIPATGLSLVASAAAIPTSVQSVTHSALSAHAIPVVSLASPAPTSPSGSHAASPPPQAAPSNTDFDSAAQTEVAQYLAAISDTERASLTTALKTGAGVPVEHDGRILARTRRTLGRSLNPPEKAKLRRILKRELGI